MNFAQRHIGPSQPEQEQMLASVGYDTLADLTAAALPAGIASSRELSLPGPLSCAGWQPGIRSSPR